MSYEKCLDEYTDEQLSAEAARRRKCHEGGYCAYCNHPRTTSPCKHPEIHNHVPPKRPTVVTLCGSTRFQDAYVKATREETLQGKIVISVGLFGHQEGLDMSGDTKKMLDELHLRKIDLSDEILVINPNVFLCDKCGKPCEVDTVFLHTGYKTRSGCCASSWRTSSYTGDSTRREIDYAKEHGKRVRYLNPTEE